MGERWKISGRRRGGCGPGMPGPYGGCTEDCKGGLPSGRRGGVKTPPYDVGVRRGV